MPKGQFPIDVHEDLDAGELSGKPLIETIHPSFGVRAPIVQEYSCSHWRFSSRVYVATITIAGLIDGWE
jgi:hypothetical protein